MKYLLNVIGLSPGGSGTVHIYAQTIHRTTQITTNFEECGPCPVFANFTVAFALQLGKKHGKSSVRVRKTSQSKKNLNRDYDDDDDDDSNNVTLNGEVFVYVSKAYE